MTPFNTGANTGNIMIFNIRTILVLFSSFVPETVPGILRVYTVY